MRAFPGFDRQKTRDFVSALCSALLAASLALASPTYAAGGGEEAAGEEAGEEEAARAAAEEPSTRPNPARRSRRTSRFANPARSGTRSVANASFGAATSFRTPR